MRGYVAFHRTALYDGIRADAYRNDPYVWFVPYLWSFCHLNQRPRVTAGMTVLWLSRDDAGTYVCDLVFVVQEVLPYRAARARYASLDTDLGRLHFEQGEEFHGEVVRPGALTYVADMGRSYIPHPSVPIEADIDAVRRRENVNAKPLTVAWRRPSAPLRIGDIDALAEVIATRARTKMRGSLGTVPPNRWWPLCTTGARSGGAPDECSCVLGANGVHLASRRATASLCSWSCAP